MISGFGHYLLADLGRRLLADLSARSPGQNVFVSPLSIGMALALLADGAAGKTRIALQKALGVPYADQEQLDQLFEQLGKQLGQLDYEYAEELQYGGRPDRDPAARADLANGLWLNKNTPFVPAFIERVRRLYQAEVRGADFTAPETTEIINRWVSEQTQGNIDQIVERTDALTAMILVSAIYFKGAWSEPFNPRRTVEAPFTLPDGSQIPCDMMAQTSEMGYVECDTYQLALLPIAGARLGWKEGGAHLAVALPRPEKTCAEVLSALGSNWQGSMARMGKMLYAQEIRLRLPRFRIAYATSLNETLKALGAGVAFSEQANFSGITPIPTRIDDVLHKTTLLVNERGAEAAAATRATGGHFGAVPVEIPEMHVDRPFVCGIVLDPGLVPLFLGVINNPERTEAAF